MFRRNVLLALSATLVRTRTAGAATVERPHLAGGVPTNAGRLEREMSGLRIVGIVLALVVAGGCGDADSIGVGGTCDANNACPKVGDADDEVQLVCLPNFKGGYCGLTGCTADADCPAKSICVTEAGTNYCFRTCLDKPECNENRTTDVESNCSANITRVGTGASKACVPPSA